MFPSSTFITILVSTFIFVITAQQTENGTSSLPFEVPDVFNISDPTVAATLEHFEVSSDTTATTKIACVDIGSRCVYNRLSYESVDVGTGQDTEDIQGAVWASTTEGAILTMGTCSNTGGDNTATSRSNNINHDIVIENNDCVVTCNANCTCAYITEETMDEPQLCRTLNTRAPTPAPKPAAPVSKTCPQQQFATEFCPTLMQQQPSSIPDGTINNYDCFNFCGGIWIDTCDIATGTCGMTQCDNATATGTLNGVVKGCTIEHYNQKLSSGNTKENGFRTGSSSANGRMSWHYVSIFAATITSIGMFHIQQ